MRLPSAGTPGPPAGFWMRTSTISRCASAEFALPCMAKPEAKPGPHVIRIASEAPDTGKKAKDTYKIPDVDTKLVIRGAVQASK